MNALTIIALVLIVPVLLIPVALVWYINIGGMMEALKEARRVKLTKRIKI